MCRPPSRRTLDPWTPHSRTCRPPCDSCWPAALAGIWIAWYWLVTVVWDTKGDANIGGGLIGFGLLVLAAGTWAFLDGRRLEPALGSTVWVLAPVLGSVAASVNQWLAEADAGERLPVSDLTGTAVFVAVLMAAPALLAFLVGRTTGRAVVG